MKNCIIKSALAGGLCFLLALGSVACDNPADGDDENTTTAISTQDAADEFYADHRAILAKPADTLTLDDEALVNAALEAYKSFRAEVKKLLAEEKAHLDILKARLDGMKGAAENGEFYTLTDLLGYLMEQPDNTADTPYTVRYYGTDTAIALYKTLGAAGKYAALDLAQSGVYGFAAGSETGRALIVSLILPDTLTETPNGTANAPVFTGFDSLTTVSAAGLTNLGEYTFSGCTNLVTVSLPKAVSIGYGAFQSTSLTYPAFPEAVSIGDYAFSGSRIVFISAMPKVVSIGNSAFRDCTSLYSIQLPEAVSIGSYAFRGTGIRSISSTMPRVTSISTGAFQDCTSFTTVALPEAKTIGNGAFQGCTALTSVTLPKAETIVASAFSGCTALTTVTLGPALPSITATARIFTGVATAAKTITFRVPYPGLYTAAGWKTGANSAVSYFWDNTAATRDNLTVALTGL
jgi:hypothetical protein